MRSTMIAALAACLGIAGASAPAGAELFSATRRVIAILAGDLFVGEAEGHLSGAGTLVIRSQANSGLMCRGQFASNDELGGSGALRCNDGTIATFAFQRIDVFRGHGAGHSSRGSLSFTYGLTDAEAVPYLKLPPGKKLSPGGSELQLLDFQACARAAEETACD